MSTLTSLLSRDGVVSLDTIEQALQRQVLEGGELDTALLELGGVPENVLGAYRAASFQLPPATRAQLERIHESLLARVPREIAREHRILPIAEDDETLVLATDAPLPLTDVQRLSRELKARLQFRIATELRVQLALAVHYDVELPSRLRLLQDRLRDRDPGALRTVQPWSTAPAARANSSEREPTRASTASAVRAQRDSSSSVVRVVPVVTLGGPSRSRPPSTPAPTRSPVPAPPSPPAETEDSHDTSPARPSKMPSAGPRRRARRNSTAPRGPVPRQLAIELLAQAPDRDRVLELFFSFARQYFECTVLFSLRDERLLGLEGSGLDEGKELSSVEVKLAPAGRVQALLSSRAPKVLNLRANVHDRNLVESIGRTQSQPCALFPVAIRQRIVLLLYGDRNGEPIVLSELSDLIAILPAVAGAFERIIHERKLQAVEASQKNATNNPRLTAVRESVAPEGTFRPSSAPPPPNRPSAVPEVRPTAASPGRTAFGNERKVTPPRRPAAAARADDLLRRGLRGKQPAAASVLGLRGDVPPPPLIPSDAQPIGSKHDDEIAERQTIQLSSERVEQALRPVSSRPPKSSGYSRSDVASERVARRRDGETTRPERPSKIPGARGRMSIPDSSPVDPPSPRTLSQPAPGMGSYAMHDPSAEVVHAQEVPRAPEAQAPRSARPDQRREDGEATEVREIVHVPEEVHAAPRSQEPANDLPTEFATHDASVEAERLVEELCRSGPDEETPTVASLLRLGDPALLALKRRFPGPLWFDRHKPRQRLPLGRDVSAVARALFAFEARALPQIVALLSAPQADVRLCAILLAADRVSPELLAPLQQRVFDSDGQVRLTAFEALPLYRNIEGFAELQKSLREKAANEREAIADRLSALEAISVLRDPGSAALLVKLSAHANRQLSVSAHRSLVSITAQDFGDSTRKWKNWLEKNSARHRVEWLIDGLMNSDERLRSVASIELQKLTQMYYGYVASADKRERERSQRRYRDWWERSGRAQFAG